MYTSLVWVPRGVAREKLPEPGEQKSAESGESQTKEQIEEVNIDAKEQHSDSDMKDTEHSEEDDGEVDIDDVLANDLDSLAFYKSNKDDPLLTDNAPDTAFDEEEMDEIRLRPTDALLVGAKSGEEVSTLEFHVFDDNPDDSDDDSEYVANTYIHNDLVLPAIPLCAAYNHVHTDSTDVNLAAVGMFTPGIDIWEVGRVNALEPIQSLGGYEQASAPKGARSSTKKKKSSKKSRLSLKDGSHSDAVLGLSWNHVQTEYLASASADKMVKIWDIESGHCACTLSHHHDKVQSVAFHPEHAHVLLTGSFDKTVHIMDLRQQKSLATTSVLTDVESCHWLPSPAGLYQVLVATESGEMYLFDGRFGSTGSTMSDSLVKWQAHDGPASACTVSHDIPGMVVTGGVDKRVKVWNISGSTKTVLLDMPSTVGAVFSAALCPLSKGSDANDKASPFVLAYGGQTDKIAVVDLGVENKALRAFYRKQVSDSAWRAIENRACRGSDARGPRRNRALANAGTGNGMDAHDSHDEDEQDSDRS